MTYSEKSPRAVEESDGTSQVVEESAVVSPSFLTPIPHLISQPIAIAKYSSEYFDPKLKCYIFKNECGQRILFHDDARVLNLDFKNFDEYQPSNIMPVDYDAMVFTDTYAVFNLDAIRELKSSFCGTYDEYITINNKSMDKYLYYHLLTDDYQFNNNPLLYNLPTRVWTPTTRRFIFVERTYSHISFSNDINANPMDGKIEKLKFSAGVK